VDGRLRAAGRTLSWEETPPHAPGSGPGSRGSGGGGQHGQLSGPKGGALAARDSHLKLGGDAMCSPRNGEAAGGDAAPPPRPPLSRSAIPGHSPGHPGGARRGGGEGGGGAARRPPPPPRGLGWGGRGSGPRTAREPAESAPRAPPGPAGVSWPRPWPRPRSGALQGAEASAPATLGLPRPALNLTRTLPYPAKPPVASVGFSPRGGPSTRVSG
jgi:hypothetical protein